MNSYEIMGASPWTIEVLSGDLLDVVRVRSHDHNQRVLKALDIELFVTEALQEADILGR